MHIGFDNVGSLKISGLIQTVSKKSNINFSCNLR